MMRLTWHWAALGTMACGVMALVLGGTALLSRVQERDAAQVRLNERQAEERRQVEARMIRLSYDKLIQAGRGLLQQARTIILVRVVKRDPTFEVLKSWTGPFSPGRVLHAQQSY